jgi:hypothetical protein
MLFHRFGGKWRKIAKFITGRHPDAIKNRYYSVLRKKCQQFKPYIFKFPPNDEKQKVIERLKKVVLSYEQHVNHINGLISVLEGEERQ